MTWATRRKIFVGTILGSIVVASAAIIFIATVYETPSCIDGAQNQDEVGIDCGGSCPYLCTNEQAAPTVLFTKALSNGSGRIDIIASIENKNLTAAARNVPYRVRVYGATQNVIREVTGTIDLPPGATQPVFIPGVASSRDTVTRAFLEIDPKAPRWFMLSPDARVVPLVSNTRFGGTQQTPRVEATLTNVTANEMRDVVVVVLIHDVQGSVIGASSTVIPRIDPQGKAVALFTWNGPFEGTPTLIEAIPLVPLSSS